MTAVAATRSRKPHRRTSLRSELLRQRYLLRNANGQVVEKPRQMFARVTRVVAAIDRFHGARDREVKTLAQAFSDMISRRVFPRS